MDSIEGRFALLTRLVLDSVATDAERAQLSHMTEMHPEMVGGVVDELLIDAAAEMA